MTGAPAPTGQDSPGGQHTVTGLAHDEESLVSYHPSSNELGMKMRSRKLAVFQSTLMPPEIYGDPEGDLLVVGWGSTQGAIVDAVRDRLRAGGRRPLQVEGSSGSDWVLLDFGDVIVHVFTETRRDYYALDTLWGDAPRLDTAALGLETGPDA
mgnify:CR=1 FL=1